MASDWALSHWLVPASGPLCGEVAWWRPLGRAILDVVDSEIDLLSVDIDGNDFHVLKAITCIKPRVIVMEYNSKFPPPILFCMDYNPEHRWQGNDCFGASLKFLEEGLDELFTLAVLGGFKAEEGSSLSDAVALRRRIERGS